MSERALDLMYALRIEDGRTWGEAAAEFQIEDAEAIQSDERPHLHFITRPRGGSKSTDIAAIALSWLAVDAPPFANGHVVASNTEQAAIVIDAAAGFVARTPALHGNVVVENERIVASNGAWVRVLPQSDAGSWGLRDAHLLICDEFCQWSETRGAKRVWTAIRSTVQKVPGCRLLVITSAGEPSHWTHAIFEKALEDPHWRVSETHGPVPWQTPEDIEALRRDLSPSEFDRLVMNIWSESEDRAISPEDYARAKSPAWKSGAAPAGLKGGGWRMRNAYPGVSYTMTVDIGIRNDSTVLCVAHRERIDFENPNSPWCMIVDHIERWTGSKKHHVQLDDVVKRIIALTVEYNKARVYADPSQFMGYIQQLQKSGVKAEEFPFTTSSVGLVATSLVQAFHNGQIAVPHYPALEEELLRVKLRESTAGVTRLVHDTDAHDDQAVSIGMAAHFLIGGAPLGQGEVWMEAMRRKIEQNKEDAEKPTGGPTDQLQNFLRSGVPGAAYMVRRTCVDPLYFGPERMCIHCGETPATHPRRQETA